MAQHPRIRGRRGISLLVLLALFFTATGLPVSAQVLYGSVVGTVQDASGALVPDAKVTVTSKSTGFRRETVTDGNGLYSVASIPAGAYTVSASAKGFKTINRDNVDIAINSTSRNDFSMEVGATTDQILVEASAVALQTDRSETRTEISAKAVQELPLNQYRNYQALLNLAPGATPAATQNSATDTPGRALRTFVNGTATNNNVTRLDGATNINIWLPHHVAYVAPAETVAEVNIATSGLDAEQGMAGGAAITVASISGTNALHGGAWEYHENQELKSRAYFQPTATPNARYTLNIFGAKIGGPIIKNKLFYFAHAEWTRQRTGGQSFFTLPDAAIRGGDFSSYVAANGAGTIYDPTTGNADGSGRSPFPGNRIPTNRLSPQALKVIALVPTPNSESSRVTDPINRTYSNNHFVNGTGVLDRGNYDGKLNWNRNDKHSVFVKYSMLQATSGGVFGLGAAGGGGVGGDPGIGDTHQYIGTIGTNYTISPTMLFDATFGLSRMDQTAQGQDFGKNYGLDTFGIPGTNGPNPLQSGLPAFSFTSFSSYGQTATWMPLERHERSYTFTSNLSIIKSKHELRMGVDAVRHQLNHYQPELDNPRGAFSFGGNLTALRGGAASANMYNSYAQFLIGLPTAMSKSIQYELMTTKEWQLGAYLRDRWQVTRNLTINIGVRLERYPLITRGDGKGIELLDPSTMKIYLGGRGVTPENPGIKVRSVFVAPRIGFAYRLGDKTVIRSGYGMTIDPLPFSRPLRGAYPLTVAATFQGADSYQPYLNLSAGSLATGIPPVVGPDLSTGVITLPGTIDNRSPYSTIKRGYVQSWNFTVERRVAKSLVGSVAYVGTQSTNVLGDRDINAAAPGAGNNGRPYFAQFGRNRDLRMWDGWMGAHYHSLQSSLSGNVGKGLFLKSAYTYSKAINMTDEDGWVSVNWNWQPTIDRNVAPAGYDRTHVFQTGFLYELPFGKGKRLFKENKLIDTVLGNWQFGGIYSAYSGVPFNVTADGGALNAPGSLQTADQIGDFVYLNGKGSNTPYFNASNFAHPGARFGTTGRNRFRGPGVANLDANLIKTIKFREKVNLQFRAEAANLSNTPRFSNPNSNLNGSNFGLVTSTAAGSERQLRFGLRLAF